jgi:putative lipoprotein
MRIPTALFATLAAAVACAPVPSADPQSPSPSNSMVMVTVNATYRERIRLTPGHRLTIRIEDVSLADAPARVMAETSYDLGEEGPPYSHRFGFQRSQIDPRHSYAARAEIRDPSGALRFVTDTHYPVLSRGAPDQVEIILRGVR